MDPINEFNQLMLRAEITPEIDVTMLHKLSEKSKKIQDVDITNEAKMSIVTDTRKELGAARRAISAAAKEARDGFHKAHKSVIAIENSILEIITPEENRLKSFEEALKAKRLHDERMLTLPTRKERLNMIGDNVEVDDNTLLGMDDIEFSTYANERQSKKNAADSAVLAEKERALRIEQEKQEAVERARKEAEDAAERKHREEIARLEREAEDVKRIEAERIATEERARKEAEEVERKLSASRKYKAFLTKNGYDESTDIVEDDGDIVTLYRKVAFFTK